MLRGIRRFSVFVCTCLLISSLFFVISGITVMAAATEEAYATAPPEQSIATEYEVFAECILHVIIEDGMDDYEKCCAVYDYIHGIPYTNTVYSEDWMENGYHMLKDRGGDCFGYFSASRLLLERLGYQVIEVTNANGFTHVWCLVSTDGGETWRHFDPTVWKWGSDGYLCMLTDEELEAYAHRHDLGRNLYSHDWDRQKVAEDIQQYQDVQEP